MKTLHNIGNANLVGLHLFRNGDYIDVMSYYGNGVYLCRVAELLLNDEDVEVFLYTDRLLSTADLIGCEVI